MTAPRGSRAGSHPILARALALIVFMAAVLVPAAIFGPVASAAPCDAPVTNPVLCENSKPGDTNWDATGGGDPSIEGFATQMSVAPGDVQRFKIQTDANSYTIDIY